MTTVYEMQNTPFVGEYIRILTDFGERVTDKHRSLFRVHYQAPDRTATSKQLAAWAGIAGGWAVVNSMYGKLGHALCDELAITPELRPDDRYRWWSVWSRGWTTPGGFVWQMLPKVAEVLEQLKWVSHSPGFTTPDEVLDGFPLIEGSVSRIVVNAYERNPEARRQCIAVHGTSCCICGFNFGAVYGPEAEGYIHVHHVRRISEVGAKYVVDPTNDLRPVCPNCHAVLHLARRDRSIGEVRQLLAQAESA